MQVPQPVTCLRQMEWPCVTIAGASRVSGVHNFKVGGSSPRHAPGADARAVWLFQRALRAQR